MRPLLIQILTILALVFPLISNAAKLTVVLDAGHGGHDPGALGATTNEKTVVLNVALKLGQQLKTILGKDINIIYTRDADFFVPLGNRAQIANNAKADLFISIHANSISDMRRRSIVQGASVYVRGFSSSKQSSEVAAIENASLKYEKTDNTSAEQSIFDDLLWNRHLEQSIRLADLTLEALVKHADRKRGAVDQNDFAVLRLTKMPAILVELDYICNPNMEKFLISETGQQKLASAIASAVAAYHSKSSKVSPPSNKPAKPESPKSDTSDSSDKSESSDSSPQSPQQETYKIQFLISDTQLPAGSPKFKGLKPDFYSDGSSFKYTVGSFSSMKEANDFLPKVKKLFPDAFVIKFKNGKRIK